MRNHFLTALVMVLALIGLTGCSTASNLNIFPGVHRVEVRQGNILTQEMVDQLRPGMTRNQVRFVMGSPLVTDTFNPARWDYIHSFRDSDGRETRQRLTLIFEGNSLVRVQGDLAPTDFSAGIAGNAS